MSAPDRFLVELSGISQTGFDIPHFISRGGYKIGLLLLRRKENDFEWAVTTVFLPE